MKCIGRRCYFYFSSDIYSYCNLSNIYIFSGQKCRGLENVENRKIKLKANIDREMKRIKCMKKELDILKHLHSHIKKNQHLI